MKFFQNDSGKSTFISIINQQKIKKREETALPSPIKQYSAIERNMRTLFHTSPSDELIVLERLTQEQTGLPP
jgi:hypothetical protein